MKYVVKNWNDEVLFKGKKFKNFTDADNYLTDFLEEELLSYYENRGEYVICKENQSVKDIGDKK